MHVLLCGSIALLRPGEPAGEGRRLAHVPDDGQLCDHDQRIRPGTGAHRPPARIAFVHFRALHGSGAAGKTHGHTPGASFAGTAAEAGGGRRSLPLPGGAVSQSQRRRAIGAHHFGIDGSVSGGAVSGAGARGTDRPPGRAGFPAEIPAGGSPGRSGNRRKMAQDLSGKVRHPVCIPLRRILSGGQHGNARRRGVRRLRAD